MRFQKAMLGLGVLMVMAGGASSVVWAEEEAKAKAPESKAAEQTVDQKSVDQKKTEAVQAPEQKAAEPKVSNDAKTAQKSADSKEPDTKAQYLVGLFAKTCVKHTGKADELRTELKTAGLPVIPDQYAASFLGGAPGQAWSATNPVGEFVIAVRQDGICAVFARQANQKDTETIFATMVKAVSRPPFAVTKGKETTATTPNGPTHTMAYKSAAPKAKTAIQFTLTTASEPTAALQAMASLMIVPNEQTAKP